MTAQKGRTYDRTAPSGETSEKALASGAVPHMTIRDGTAETEVAGWPLGRAAPSVTADPAQVSALMSRARRGLHGSTTNPSEALRF
jgi:hypothetical protein